MQHKQKEWTEQLDWSKKPKNKLKNKSKKGGRRKKRGVRALAAASQPFSLSLGIQTTFYFPIQKYTTLDSLKNFLYY
jgi:hypothetical protein